MTGWGVDNGTMKSCMCVHFTEASQFWIDLLKCMPIMQKLWFREIRTKKTCKNYGLGKLDQAQEKIKIVQVWNYW